MYTLLHSWGPQMPRRECKKQDVLKASRAPSGLHGIHQDLPQLLVLFATVMHAVHCTYLGHTPRSHDSTPSLKLSSLPARPTFTPAFESATHGLHVRPRLSDREPYPDKEHHGKLQIGCANLKHLTSCASFVVCLCISSISRW